MKGLRVFVGILNSLALIMLIITIAIQIPTYNIKFYDAEFTKHQIPASIDISQKELLDVTTYMLDYMKGKNDDLVVYANIGGSEREFFNEKEKKHMIDVKLLMLVDNTIRNISGVLFFLTMLIMLMLKNRPFRFLSKMYITMFLLISTIVGYIVFLFTKNFDLYFTKFHEIFFTNDLWLLDYNTDLLIRLVPLEFFMDISFVVACIIVVMFLVVIFSSIICLIITRDKKPENINKIDNEDDEDDDTEHNKYDFDDEDGLGKYITS